MSDGAAVGIGLLIGLVIVIPVFAANRHEIADGLRRLLGIPTDANEQDAMLNADASFEGLSVRVLTFAFVSASITLLAGILLRETIVLISGVILLINALLGAVVSRRRQAASLNEKQSKRP